MKEFIQRPLCMALQTPQVYNRKTFPHIIIRRLYVWYLKNVQSPANLTSCPSHLSCQQARLSLSILYCMLTLSKVRLSLYLITQKNLVLNSQQENCSISCTKVWSIGRSVLFNNVSSNQPDLRGMEEVKKKWHCNVTQCHMCSQARTACMRFTHHSHCSSFGYGAAQPDLHSNLGRENQQKAIPACLLCHLGRAGTDRVKRNAAHSLSRLDIDVTVQVQCHL